MAEKRRKSLLEIMEEESTLEKLEHTQNSGRAGRKTSVLAIADNSGKRKQISAKVNEKTYDIFTEINKLQGLSNNSALNMIITKYVRENIGILKEDSFI